MKWFCTICEVHKVYAFFMKCTEKFVKPNEFFFVSPKYLFGMACVMPGSDKRIEYNYNR